MDSSSPEHNIQKGPIEYKTLDEAIKNFESIENGPEETEKEEEFQKRLNSVLKRVLVSGVPFFKQVIYEDMPKAIAYFDNVMGFRHWADLSSEVVSKNIDDSIAQALEDDLGFIDENIDKTNPETIRAIINLISESSEYETDKKIDFLVRHFEKAFSSIEEEDDPEGYSEVVRPIFEHGSDEQIEYLQNFIRRKFSDMSFDPKDNGHLYIPWLLTSLSFNKNSRVASDAEFFIQEHIEHFFKMNYSELKRDWHISSRGSHNYRDLGRLEAERPGIGAFLNKQFGISDFDRYPHEILIRQYDQRNNTNLRYGIIIFPKDDWNGAFYNYSETFQKLAEQLGADIGLRIYEVKNTKNALSSINSARHKYGKAEFLIIGGHGGPLSIKFGTAGDLTHEKLGRKGSNALQAAFVDNPTIILASCNTGMLGGIGEQISRLGLHGATVFAPNVSTSLESIEVKKDNHEKLRFQVDYKDEESVREYTKDKLL